MPEIYGNKQVVQGEDIILLVDDKTTLHATTHTLKVDLEMKELRTKDTDGKEKWPGDVSWSVDGDDSIGNSHTAEEVLDLVLQKKLVDVVVKSPLTGLAKMYTGKAYITTFSLSTPAGDNASYSYSLTGSGNLTPVDKPKS
ncbi:MAG TPA: phage tail tube protein [Alistipes sp.]|uniref:phage tail tube protein n=1 Tax=unclassified Alistipes TaxID=2608932 RepID=UPI00258C7AC2|nr:MULTISPECIES: phage tail tube protein [unclassified Alistipes]HUN14242.1 phage tail tube protein [Alistipes sp.]